MKQKRTYRQYDEAFKKGAVNLILEQDYSVAEASKSLGIATNLLYKWKIEQTTVPTLDEDEKAELKRLRKEVKDLKKGECLLCKTRKVRYQFISHMKINYPVKTLF